MVAVADVDGGAGELLAGGRSADVGAGLEQQRAHAGAGEVGGGDQPVVAGADHDRVEVVARSRRGSATSIVPVSRTSRCRSRLDGVACRCDIRIPPTRRTARARHRPAARRAQHPGPAARRGRAARPAPAVQHRPADRRARGRRPPSSASARSSTCGCCRRSPTRSRTSTPGRPARSGCRRPRCWRCSTTSAAASPRRRPASSCS